MWQDERDYSLDVRWKHSQQATCASNLLRISTLKVIQFRNKTYIIQIQYISRVYFCSTSIYKTLLCTQYLGFIPRTAKCKATRLTLLLCIPTLGFKISFEMQNHFDLKAVVFLPQMLVMLVQETFKTSIAAVVQLSWIHVKSC